MRLELEIRQDDLSGEAIGRLLSEHWTHMHEVTPPGSVHALALEGLKHPQVTFWSAWAGRELAGCGALKQLDHVSAEIKSMRTAGKFRRKGVGKALLHHIVKAARQRGLKQLYLETGAMAVFEPARRMYLQYGFRTTGPFGDYKADANSVFMKLEL